MDTVLKRAEARAGEDEEVDGLPLVYVLVTP